MDDLAGLPSRRVIVPDLTKPPAVFHGADAVSLSGQAFATDWRIRLSVDRAKFDGTADLHGACQNLLAQIDAEMSPYRLDSAITAFNMAPPGIYVPLPDMTLKVLARALEIAHFSDSAFDPTVLPAVELWGFGARVVTEGLPSKEDIENLRQRPQDWRGIEIVSGGAARSPGVRLDLCAIAKGFAVDELTAILATWPGVHAGLVEIGGELKGFGTTGAGLPWWVDIENHDPRTVVALCDWAIATSGEDQRAFTHGGRVYSHTIDARQQAPAMSNIIAATVMDKECWRADALATALVVMGESHATAFAEDHDIPCLLRLRGGGEWLSPRLEAWV